MPVNAVRDPDPRVGASTIGRATMTVTVPEIPGGRSNEPLDLGTITAKLDETLKAGDHAPDFTVRRINVKDKGGPIKLGDYQGKLVLIVFWATWSRPSLSEMIALKDVQTAFGGHPRFAMIGLACDHIIEPAEDYLRKNDLPWPQGFAGRWGAERRLELQDPRDARDLPDRPGRPHPRQEPPRGRSRRRSPGPSRTSEGGVRGERARRREAGISRPHSANGILSLLTPSPSLQAGS